MMSRKVVLSICIPTYNREESLRCLLSIIADQYDDSIEVIVSDNNSQDGTIKFLNKFKLSYPWLVINRNDSNLGIDNNLRKLASLASGKYILFLGDDDYIQKGFIKTLLPILEKGSYGLVHLSACRKDKNGNYVLQEKKRLSKYINNRVKCSEQEIRRIVSEELADFMFMSINVYSRLLLDHCINNSDTICSNVLWSLYGLFNGTFCYIPNLIVDGGTNITWRDSVYDVWFKGVPVVLSKAVEFGLSQETISYIIEHHIAKCLASRFISFTMNRNERKKILNITGRLSFRVYCYMIFYVLKGIIHKNKKVKLNYLDYFNSSK